MGLLIIEWIGLFEIDILSSAINKTFLDLESRKLDQYIMVKGFSL